MMKHTLPAMLAAAVALGGCTTTPIAPWEKGVLAKPGMAFEDNVLQARFTEHVYSSKENSSGGSGVGGGGCGCN
jgi:hypothetical protein